MNSVEELGGESASVNHIHAAGNNEKANRWFYSIVAFLFLLLIALGFMPFYIKGEGMGGRHIAPALFPLVLTHALLLTGWMVLFFIQATLISTRNRRVHMKLGWAAVAVASGVAVSGFIIAIQSVSPIPDAQFRGMAYQQFMLIMFVEIIVFSLFVGLAVAFRKRAKIHKAMMLLATLSIIAAATIRMPILSAIFGDTGWPGVFGPLFALGIIVLVLRSLLTKSFDVWLAVGYAAMVVLYVAATKFAATDAGSHAATAILSK